MSKMTDKEIPKGYCNRKLCPTALVIINRQQAEIERLQRLLEQEEKSKNSLTKKCYKDGIKEFAEKLKADINKTWYYELENDIHNARALKRVDELVKEMVGEGE